MRHTLLTLLLSGCCYADCAIPGAAVEVRGADGAPVAAATLNLLLDGDVVASTTCGPDAEFTLCGRAVLPVEEAGTYEIQVVVDGVAIEGPIFTATSADLAGQCCGGFYGDFVVEVP